MPLRVVTANLFLGRVSASSASDLIERLRPDVLACQELVPTLAAAIGPMFVDGAIHREGHGLSIGLFLAEPARFGSVALASHHAVTARLSSGVEIITTHLPAPHTLPPWKTFKRRAADVASLVAHLRSSPEQPRILLGDLNSSPSWPAYRRLREHLTDAPAAVALGNGHRPARTWGPWPGSPRLVRIDHVLSTGIRPVTTSVAAIPGSDHSAVIVDYE